MMAASANDPKLVEALNKFHREKLDNNTTISKRLKADYDIEMAWAANAWNSPG